MKIDKEKLLKVWLESCHKDSALCDTVNVITREIRLSIDIESYELNSIISSMEKLFQISPEPITLKINSNGGVPDDALILIDHMDNFAKDGFLVNTHVHGMVASAATIIAMGATGTRTMSKHAHMMFHQISSWNFGLEKKSDTKSRLMYIDSLTDIITNFYISKSNIKTKEQWESIMSIDTYLNSEKCLSMGIIDSIK